MWFLFMHCLRSLCITAETTTAFIDNVVTSEAESTSVTIAASDAVTTSFNDDGVSTEGVTTQMTQQASSSLPTALGKLPLNHNRLLFTSYVIKILVLGMVSKLP